MKEHKSKNEELRASYNKKIDELAKAEVNQDQKDLFKKILEKADDADLQNIYQMLIQRVKVGFTFDAAPSVDQKAVALLVKDEEKSFINDKKNIDNQNILIIGENYDALKNLLIVEREREEWD
ncbi:hypothetical protein [Mycoplasmopsis fermentans]|uniref:hypothetical protein n=1 Tax=Mycoplasmopsis fermentans TaxID=2115 RepID=UPI0001E32EDF|nr:hypothetical protein [Mycoplasmopsis fermentans]ADN68656.1 conserved hypothetical protein [Mycoplasmopsis fermentans JER]